MHNPELNIYHHPTTTVFVDDSWDFLRSITWSVDRVPYRSFADPYDALSYVDYFCHRELAQQNTENTIQPHILQHATQKRYDPYRFAEPSVIVVDYSMPVMNGLELCSKISSPDVKKVLLTGVADEKVAVDALNSRLIDFYISKSEASLAPRLQTIISQLENRYFQDAHGWTRNSHIKSSHQYLFDSAFADYFEDLCEKLNIIEHYPSNAPQGFHLFDRYGKASFLGVYPRDRLADIVGQAAAICKDKRLIEQMHSGDFLPLVFTDGEGQATVTTSPISFSGEDDCYACALVDRMQFDTKLADSCYDDFLKTSGVDFRRACLS